MDFNTHSDLQGLHAFLSPSKYHWINYNEEKLESTYTKFLATQRGVRLHALACECIQMGIKLPKSPRTINWYVNDAIGYKMQTEQPLYYSANCFGTTDTICFRKNLLRIHDLKTGETPASMHQLEVYAALFCLEYKVNPNDIGIELRLYQANEIQIHEPLAEDIHQIIDKIIIFDKQIEKLKIGV